MKTTDISYGVFVFYSISILLLCSETSMVGAQPTPPGGESNNNDRYPYTAKFSPSMAIIVVVLVAALFFMGFFSIYIRHCAENSSGDRVRRALSLRSRRAPAARGLEASVLETFPTFSYSEVKDHKIGKGTLECAVCLNEFSEDETIRLIPKCDHVFHLECIDAWLESHVTCPVCRANLAQPAPESTNPVGENETNQMNETVQRSNSTGTGGEVVVQLENENAPPPPPRSWSVARRPIMFKFRSHSTGHDSLVLPGENLDRFTLRLPEQVRKEVVDRAMLNRAKSCAAGGSWGRAARSYRRSERPELEVKSDRWNFSFFSRALSMRSPRVGSENGQGSRSGRTPVKMPSFKCLEPRAADEAHLFSARSPV